MEFVENRSDVVVFWGFSNSTGESILNSLEAVYLGDVYVGVYVRLPSFYRLGTGIILKKGVMELMHELSYLAGRPLWRS